MEWNWIYENIDKLQTPVGYFYVTSGEDTVAFHVARNSFDVPYEIYDDHNTVIDTIHSETNYTIAVPTESLTLGKGSVIRFSAGKWDFFGPDEHTEGYTAVIDHWVVGIGGYDPNDDKKSGKDWDYSTAGFTEYDIEALDDNSGFRFWLLDRKKDYILFRVAWIEIGSYPVIQYEDAVAFWVT